MRRMIAAVVVVPLLAACGDDGYSAAEREVTMAEVLESGPMLVPMLEPRQYEQAWEVVTGVLDIDPTDPESFLEVGESSARPNRTLPETVVACAWGAVLREGGADDDRLPWHEDLDATEGFDALRQRLLDSTGGGDCSSLDPQGIAAISRDVPGSTDGIATWSFRAEVQALEAAIGIELAPEIAEAYAG